MSRSVLRKVSPLHATPAGASGSKRRNEMTDEINQHGVRPVAFWLAMSLLLTFGSVALTVALYGVLHR